MGSTTRKMEVYQGISKWKGEVKKVIIVCSGRIESEQAVAIKNIMSWLGYSTHKSEFVFLYNKVESLEECERVECLGEMLGMIGADARQSVSVPRALAQGFVIPGQSDEKTRVVYAMCT